MGFERFQLSVTSDGYFIHNVYTIILDNSICFYTFENVKTKEIFTGLIKDFKKKYNLQASKISNVMNGKRNHHKNWTFKKQD